jgi:TolB-like protein/lipoprotein NlpI
MSILGELKRRNVTRVALLYIVAAWLVLQVADVSISLLSLPEWVGKVVFLLLALGFPFALIFSWVYELTPEGLRRESEIDRDRSITHATGRRINILTALLLILAISAVVLDRVIPEGGDTAASSEDAEAERAAAASGPPSIAVLPFVNMSNDPEQEYFSDGISEELLNVLARYPELRVAARTSAFQFKGRNLDVGEIARKLGVGYVLEGSVRKSGDTIRITAQLIEADTGYHLWSSSYDRQLVDIFVIQDEISAAIGEALEIELALASGSEGPAATIAATTNMDAFDAYVRGRQLINLRGRKNIEAAVGHLEHALELDGSYAPAHAQLAIAITLLSNTPGSYGELSMDQIRVRAQPHVDRAFELEPDLPEAYGARTLLSITSSDYQSAIDNAERALALNPSYADALNWLHLAYAGLGRYEQSIRTTERQLEVDPLSIVGRANYAGVLGVRGEMERALAIADMVADQSEKTAMDARARIYYYAGEPASALQWALKSYARSPDDSFNSTFVCRSLGQLGLVHEAVRVREDMLYWAYLNARMWPELIRTSRTRLEKDPADRNSQLYLANALHLSGEVEVAQPIYESLHAIHPDLPIIDNTSETLAPSARATLGRARRGDLDGAAELAGLTRRILRQREMAGIVHAEDYRASAVLHAVDGAYDTALEEIDKATRIGPRDPSIFSEPAFDAIRDTNRFEALEARLKSFLAGERARAVQMLCFDNPVPETWEPLPETCAGIERAY